MDFKRMEPKNFNNLNLSRFLNFQCLGDLLIV